MLTWLLQITSSCQPPMRQQWPFQALQRPRHNILQRFLATRTLDERTFCEAGLASAAFLAPAEPLVTVHVQRPPCDLLGASTPSFDKRSASTFRQSSSRFANTSGYDNRNRPASFLRQTPLFVGHKLLPYYFSKIKRAGPYSNLQ